MKLQLSEAVSLSVALNSLLSNSLTKNIFLRWVFSSLYIRHSSQLFQDIDDALNLLIICEIKNICFVFLFDYFLCFEFLFSIPPIISFPFTISGYSITSISRLPFVSLEPSAISPAHRFRHIPIQSSCLTSDNNCCMV